MRLTLDRPIVFFDIESTGLNISTDAIVELSFVKVFPDGSNQVKTWRMCPWNYETHCQLPISEGASEVNGIKDSDVAGEKRFFELAPEIATMLADSDLGGYNSAKFDLPMLAEEFEKVHAAYRKIDRTTRTPLVPEVRAFYSDVAILEAIKVDFHSKKMIDVQGIYHKMEPRNLKAAYRFYCDKDLENAHTAEADTMATYEVLESQLERYAESAELRGKTGVDALSAFSCQKTTVDFAGRLYKDTAGEVRIAFGKNKDKTAREVWETDPSYFQWIYGADFTLDTKQQFYALQQQFKAEQAAAQSAPPSQESLEALMSKFNSR